MLAGITLTAQNSHIFHLNYKLISLRAQHNLTIFIIRTMEDNRTLITEFDRMRIHSSFARGCWLDTYQLTNPSPGILCEPVSPRSGIVKKVKKTLVSNPWMFDNK